MMDRFEHVLGMLVELVIFALIVWLVPFWLAVWLLVAYSTIGRELFEGIHKAWYKFYNYVDPVHFALMRILNRPYKVREFDNEPMKDEDAADTAWDTWLPVAVSGAICIALHFASR